MNHDLTKNLCDSVSLIFRKENFLTFCLRKGYFIGPFFREKGSNFWAMDEDVAPLSGAWTRQDPALGMLLKCVQCKLDIAGTAIEMHHLLF